MSDAPERYVRRRELAALMGVSVSTIDRRVRDGMPSYLWGARSRRFLPSEAIAWAKTNGDAQLATVAFLDERRQRVQ
jgi:predicted DNA-binding transcriptional regulator AlpA